MGGSASKNPYKKYESTIKGDDKWASFMKNYQLSHKDGKAFFKTFLKMDTKCGGDITYEQFAKAWKISAEDRGVIQRFFVLEDVKKGDNEDLLYFQEWAVMNYDFCTLKMDGLVRWTFNLFDPDGSGSITEDEFKKMCCMTMGMEASRRGTEMHAKMTELMKRLDRNKDKKISLAEFTAAERSDNAAIIFAPLLELQQKMRKSIIGDGFWKKHVEIRKNAICKAPIEVYEAGGTFERKAKGKKGKKGSRVSPS